MRRPRACANRSARIPGPERHHLFDDGHLPQPLTLASAAAARTSRIRLGTAILIGGLRPAAQMTKDVVIVDIISGGRLELAIGAGYRRPEF